VFDDTANKLKQLSNRSDSQLENLNDVAAKLRLRHMVDQSPVVVPPSGGTGDLPIIFENVNRAENQESGTKLTERQAGLLALGSAIADMGMKDVNGEPVCEEDDLDFFWNQFKYHYCTFMASVEGFRSKQLVQICSGEQQFEKKAFLTKLKSRKEEDFV